MLFNFLKYLHPTHYFILRRKLKFFIYPDLSEVPKEILSQFPLDDSYISDKAKVNDISWRLIYNGYTNSSKTINEIQEIPVFDNYVFSRKYFNKVWVLYVLILRVLSFNNPFKEFSAFYKSRRVDRYKFTSEIVNYSAYKTYQSKLIKNKPLVSVIIPTLNRYQYLNDVLKDLEQQDYTNFEVIVVDQSKPYRNEFYNQFKLNMRVEYQKERALWLARNNAIRQSKGEYLLLFDDDSRVENDWISSHIKTLDFFNADISSGVSISKTGAEIPAHYAYFKISDQLDTGNVLVKKEVFQRLGLFDRQFEKQRMGDGEFGLRAYINGCKNISNPYAKRLHLKVGVGGLREMGSWDAFRTKNLFQPRPIPSVLYFYRRYFGRKRSILAILRTVPISIVPYRYKKNRTLLFCSSIIALILSPLILFQILKSWRLASEKIKEGPKIEFL